MSSIIDEPSDSLDSLSTLAEYTGLLVVSWFYLVLVAIDTLT